MPILIYAEHLQNIRTLSIQASLDNHSNQETTAELSTDRDKLTLFHDGEQASILLPVKLTSSNVSALSIPPVPSKELTFRIRLGELDTSAVGDGEIIVPWTAPSLSAETELSCRACNAIIVNRGSIKTWKDLPSEGWAEMMDFWHCHKPNEPDDHNNSGKKSYGASSVLTAASKVGLVNATSFLLAADDCHKLKTANSSVELTCERCGITLGVRDEETQSYKLYKRTLSLPTSAEEKPHSFSDELWLSCQLLTTAQDQGLRKLHIACSTDEAASLSIWLFAPDLVISSSSTPSPQPSRVAKIMWKQSPSARSDEMLSQQSLSEGSMEMHSAEMTALRDCLSHSQRLLPAAAMKFQDWNVGLLQRLCSTDL